MNDSTYRRIEASPRFQELVAKRGRFAWTLSAIMLGLYSAFILLIAFAPKVLGTRIHAETAMTWGIPLGLFVILFTVLITGIYVRRANREYDELSDAIRAKVGA